MDPATGQRLLTIDEIRAIERFGKARQPVGVSSQDPEGTG